MKEATRHYVQGARARAAEETGRRIVDAFLARLMTQWYDEITLDGVAADAAVTVQTVIRRFGGKDGLLAESVTTLGDQINRRRGAPSLDRARLVENLVHDYEEVGDSVIRLLALEGRHPALASVLSHGRREHREWVRAAFSPVLVAFPDAVRAAAIDALVVATDVYTWKLLRRDMGRSVTATRAAIRTLIEGIISEIKGGGRS